MSAPASALVVHSVTGVEVALPVAGPGARAFAFIIDWHIRTILAVSWYVIGMIVYNRGLDSFTPPFEPDAAWFGCIAIPAAAIYFLYHPALEIAMRGRTPGKRIAGVRLVTASGGTPLLGAHLIRNVFRLVDNFPIFYGLGIVMTMITRNHVRLGDLAAGTLLVYDRGDVALLEHVRNAKLDASTADIVNELLKRWDMLDVEARRRLASQVLSEGGAGVGASSDDASLRAELERIAQGARA